MENRNTLKALTLTIAFLRVWISIGLLFFSILSSANTETIGELSLRYRMMSNDYQTSSELLDTVFENFFKTQPYWTQSTSELAHNKIFLAELQKFSQTLNQLITDQPSAEQKMRSLETLITILSASSGGDERLAGQSLSKMYQGYLKTMMASSSTPTPAEASTRKGFIQIKKGEVFKTMGTYGIWGLWLGTTTSLFGGLSPTMDYFVFYTTILFSVAAAPFSVGNQIWGQVFDRLEKKTSSPHDTAIQYVKDTLRSIKYFKHNKPQQCLRFYEGS